MQRNVQSRAPRRVALIVETSLASGRNILRGIARYVREHGPWAIYHQPRGLEEDVPQWIAHWNGDGIIARVQTPSIAQAVLATGLPTVDVLGMVPQAGLPLVHPDDKAVAEMAARHLLERGFRRFGYCGIGGAAWAETRRQAFAATVRRAGFDCAECLLPAESARGIDWESQQEQLAHWVAGLPRPLGIMVCNDPRGELLLEACRRVGVAVPEEAAVVGVDNDEPLCEICDPPLSSVEPDHFGVGYRGAQLLDQLMSGKPAPDGPIFVPPLGVVTRLSSDVLAVDDPMLVRSLSFIRRHACDGISVDDVLAQVPLSRSTLQRRFRRHLGRTIHDEICRVRLRRVCELLDSTDLPIDEVAHRAGFVHRQYLGEVFKAQLGMTPAEYRRRVRDSGT